MNKMQQKAFIISLSIGLGFILGGCGNSINPKINSLNNNSKNSYIPDKVHQTKPTAKADTYTTSFNCEDASSRLDKFICSNEELGKLDKYMSQYYFKVRQKLDRKNALELVTTQRKWLNNREKQCKSLEVACLRKYYKQRIFELRNKHENLSEYTSISAQELQGTRSSCKLEGITFPDNMVVYAGGAYSGKKIKYQIDKSGHQATQFDVIINSPNEPVALILGAYEPSIWNIAWTKGTYIEAVVVTGYHKQAIAGLSNDVPILNSSYHNKGACTYMYVSDKNLKKINPLSRQVYDKNVKMVYYAQNGKIVFGKQINGNTKLYTSKDNPPNSFVNTSSPLAGKAGLNELVSKGMLRPSTTADINKWAQLKEEAYKKIKKHRDEELPPVANAQKKTTFKPQHVHNGYVILKKITIPAGLFGGNLATFFLEKGVPYPAGNLGHSRLYDFNTITCSGVGCPRR